MKTIEQTYTINAPINKVWEALTSEELIKQWTGGPAKFDPVEGGEFRLWAGEIHGTNTKLVENKLLEEDWHSLSNSDRLYKVSFTLSEKDGVTTVKLSHANVADDEMQDFAEGWPQFYFTPIKELLER